MEPDVTKLNQNAAPLVRALVEPFTTRADDLGLAAAVVWGFGAAPYFRKGWDAIEVGDLLSNDLSPSRGPGRSGLDSRRRRFACAASRFGVRRPPISLGCKPQQTYRAFR